MAVSWTVGQSGARRARDSGQRAAWPRTSPGMRRAFQELVGRYRGRLLNFVNRMIGDRERAEDLVQEAFIRVHRHLHRFDPTKKFSTWIYTIASNLAKNELRNRSRSPLVFYQSLRPPGEEDQRPLQFEDSSSRPDDMYASRYLREMVDATVATLAPHHREVFVHARAGGPELRGDRPAHALQPRHGEEPAQPRPARVRGADRTVSGLTGHPAAGVAWTARSRMRGPSLLGATRRHSGSRRSRQLPRLQFGMPAQTYDALLRSLPKGELAPVYYLHGPEDILKDEAVQAIVDSALDPALRDFNFDQRRPASSTPKRSSPSAPPSR